MNSFLTIAASTLGLALLAPTAQAALISGVTASTDMGAFPSPFNILNTVNGSGFAGNNPTLSGLHAVSSTDNAWRSSVLTPTGTITFDLGATYDVDGFSFWNFNGSFHSMGIRGVTVQSSTDGSSFSTIPGAPTEFARAIGGPLSPEQFSFSTPVTASHVRFVVGSNWGDPDFTGFSEVQFDGSPAAVPEPTGIVGLLAVGGVFLTTKRRRA